jgi:nucleotide-binding universal stress UspA family protein
MAVHYATRPVLVVPYPLLTAEYADLANGPVLVGFDGSDAAGMALAAAGRLFPTRDQLLVVIDDGDVPTDLTPPQTGNRPTTHLRLPSERGTHGRGVASALARCARDQAAAVVVVGSRGRSAVREILLGSVAMATLHHAYRPVLVVPASSRL